MARGQVFSVAASQNQLLSTQSKQEEQSFALLNPNDGVVYLALNRSIADIFPSSWDWKLPSQSYGLFPGPWESIGVYYLDQSGAGLAGDFNLYDSDIRLTIPDIHSIGRALQTRSSALDIAEGVQPANPGAGIIRLWANGGGEFLNILRSDGTDARVLDTGKFLTGAYAGFAIRHLLYATGGTQASAITVAANNWSLLSGTFNFTKLYGGSDLLINVAYGGVIGSPVGTNGVVNLNIALDSGGVAAVGLQDYFCNAQGLAGNNAFFSGTRLYRFSSITAGLHNVNVQGFWQTASTWITNAPAAGNFFQMHVMELLI